MQEMADESLDALLNQIRGDLEAMGRQANQSRGPVSQPPQASQPAKDAQGEVTFSAGAQDAFDDLEPEDQEVRRHEEAIPETTALPESWTAAAHAIALVVAAAGGFLGLKLLLGLGLLGHLAATLFLSPAQSKAPGDASNLARRLDQLEERLSALHLASREGAIPRQLEEEIRETRRILIDLVKALERSQNR
jgi:hypothetical protein